MPPLAWACLGAVIVFCTAIPYLLNSWALARTHASHVAFYVFLQPVITTALAILILGETFNPTLPATLAPLTVASPAFLAPSAAASPTFAAPTTAFPAASAASPAFALDS